MRALLILSLISCGAAAAPQGLVDDGVARLPSLASPQDLGGTWKVRFDDDDAYRDPGFDDSGWERVQVPLGLGLQGHEQHAGVFWYRFRVELPASGERPPLLGVRLGQLDSAVEVFVDGVFVGGRGRIPAGPDDPGTSAHDQHAVDAIPDGADDDGVLVIALRGWRSPLRADSNPGRGGVTHRPLEIGDVKALARAEVLEDLDDVALAAVFLVAGLYHLHLWRRRREQTAYLWFGLFSVEMFAYILFSRHISYLLFDASSLVHSKLALGAVFLAFPTFIQFLWPFLDTPIRWWWRLVQAASLLFFVVSMAWPSLWFLQKHVKLWELFVVLPELFGMVALVARRAWQRDPEARTVLIGVLAILATSLANMAVERNLVQLPELTNLSFGIFVLSMAASQSNRFTRVYGELDGKNAELRRMDKLKDEFLANTSHELRTPLNGIIGITESLVDGAAGQQSAETVENLQMIMTSGHRLSSLINDILDFSKLRDGKVSMQLAPVDIHAAADIVVRLLAPLARKKGLTLDNKVPRDLPVVLADDGRLQQILTNLIGNAVKFTEEGGVVVEGSVDGEFVCCTVTDTGPGIAARDHARIFNAFEQGDGSTEREYGGTGLGLSITARLVELHGGRVSLVSSPGAGASFTVRLPRVTADARERAAGAEPDVVRRRAAGDVAVVALPETLPTVRSPQAKEVPSSPAAIPQPPLDRRYKVLLVDDEPINLRVLENHLAALPFDVSRAESGAEALALLADGFKPDLVLLDVMMPRMSGYEVCRQIRERFTASEVPVVLVTAKDRVVDVVSGFDAGANDYLTKPVAKSELLARIRTHLRVARMNEATSRFVPFEFLSMLGKESLVDVERGDQVQKEMSVLFSDIRSFTTIVEKNSPTENFRFINEYLGHMEPSIKEHGGFVDSFIGDAIMALFEDHGRGGRGGAVEAVSAGVAMQRGLPEFNATRAALGLPLVAIGVGVNTGLLTCGTIGGRFHVKCGVIGDPVNTASRIEGMTKMYGARFLVGEATRDALPDGRFTLRVVDRVTAKGKKLATTIYEVLDADDDDVQEKKRATLARYEAALAAYHARRFAEGRDLLEALAKINPADHLVTLYLERCRAFVAAPPPSDWDGVVKLETK